MSFEFLKKAVDTAGRGIVQPVSRDREASFGVAANMANFFDGGNQPLAKAKIYPPGDEPNPKNPGGISNNELKRRTRAEELKKLEKQRADALVAAKKKIAADIQKKQKEASKAAAKRSGGLLGDLKAIGGGAVKAVGKVATAPIAVAKKIPVVKEVVKGAATVVKTAAKASNTIAKTVGKVPVIGAGLKGVYDLTANAPFKVAGDIASGKDLDKIALNALRDQVQSVRDVAPYAQTVISFVPGVGQGISAGLGAGLALASGQPITEAIAAGIRGALPGGALAKAAFDVGKAAIEGKPITNIVLQALPINADQKKILGMGLDAAGRLAKGQSIDKALLAQADKVIKLLPKDVGKALDIGIAIAEGKSLQSIAIKHVAPAAIDSLKAGGLNLIKSSPTLAAAAKITQSAAVKDGYAVGVGLMAKPVKPIDVVAIRTQLSDTQKQGFDLAVAARAGMVETHMKKPASVTTPEQAFGYVVMTGLKGTSSAKPIAQAVANPKAPTSAGANVALAVIAEHDRPWYQRVVRWVFGKAPK